MKYIISMVLILVVVGISSCNRTVPNQDNNTVNSTEISILTSPQKRSDEIKIKRVVAKQDGFIVIHGIDATGKPIVPASLGHARIKAGVNNNIEVDINETPTADKVIAMLHIDDHNLGVYEFGPGQTTYDKPVVLNGKPVVMPVTFK